MARRQGLFMEFEFRLAYCTTLNFKYIIISEIVIFLSFKKKEIKCISHSRTS